MENEVVQTLYNIDDYNSVMTVFFIKRTGVIKTIADGRHDMSMFGDEEIEYTQIWDYTVIEKDEFVRDNMSQFEILIDKETGNKELNYVQPIHTSKYKVR